MARLVILPLQPHLEYIQTEALPHEEAQAEYSVLFPKLTFSPVCYCEENGRIDSKINKSIASVLRKILTGTSPFSPTKDIQPF